MKKIALTGAHGVGKTTLANAVREALGVKGYPVQLAPELPREICGIVGNPEFFRQGENTLAKQMALLYGQVQLEYTMGIVPPRELILTDRTLADHWAYTVHFFRGELEKQDLFRVLETMIAQYLSTYSLIGYVPIEFAPLDDGIRESDAPFQAAIDRLIKKFMDDHSIPYITVSGTVEQRQKQYMAHLGV